MHTVFKMRRIKGLSLVKIGIKEKEFLFARHGQARLAGEEGMQACGAAFFYPGADQKILLKELHGNDTRR